MFSFVSEQFSLLLLSNALTSHKAKLTLLIKKLLTPKKHPTHQPKISPISGPIQLLGRPKTKDSMSVSVPIKLFHEGEGNTVIVELTNGEKYRGHLVKSEDNMNCQLTSVTMRARDGKLSKLENVFIRGSRIRYVVLPDILKQSPLFQKVQKLKEAKESVEREKNKLKGSGLCLLGFTL